MSANTQTSRSEPSTYGTDPSAWEIARVMKIDTTQGNVTETFNKLCRQATNIVGGHNPATLQLHKALQMAKSSGASEELVNTLQRAADMTTLREKFADAGTTAESAACKVITEQTYVHDWTAAYEQGKMGWHMFPNELSGHLEGQFLKTLVSMQKARQVLDIGMFSGYSALSMAEALPADGELITIDIFDYLRKFAEPLFKQSPHGGKIKVLIGQAKQLMAKMVREGQKFDIMFLDAVKEEYKDYLKMAIDDNLLSPRGTILVDNAFLYGTGYLLQDSTSKQFADLVTGNPNLHSVLVPIRDGVWIIRRKTDVEGH